MIESFSLLSAQGDHMKNISLLISINMFYPDTTVYVLCDKELENIVKQIPFKFTINIVYLDYLENVFNDAKEDISKKVNYYRLHFTLMEEALKHKENTLFLDRYNILLNKFTINFEECKNKIGGIKILDSDLINPTFLFIDSVETIKQWEKLIYNKSIELYNEEKLKLKMIDASNCSCDISTNETNETNETDKEEDLSNNDVFIDIFCKLLIKKVDILQNNLDFLCYLPKTNSITSYDFLRRENNINIKDITYNGPILLYKDEPISSLLISREINDDYVHKVNSGLIKLLLEINKKYYRLFNLQGNKKIIFNLPPNNNIIPVFHDKNLGLYNLIRLWNKKFTDIILFSHEFESNYFELGDIILYNYPDDKSFTNNIINKKILFGTLDIHNSNLSILENNKIKYEAWIYWPKHANKVEDFIENYGETMVKTTNSVFIGSSKHEERKHLLSVVENIKLWDNSNNMLEYDDYLFEIAGAKYGICCKETTPKSHRLMEYLALGTVPIIVNNEVNTNSFMVPLEENKHFLSASSIDDIPNVINSTTHDTWNNLSNHGKSWYMENIYSENSFKNLFTYFLMN